MALAPGTRLGPYKVTALLGAGGMGEVYKARDTKLDRDVALKILPDAFALDGDRIARFRREAQVLASLNHPNIAAIYGFEDNGSTHALVLELVEGPTLADRIATGPIPFDEALPIARQIAEALESAHEQGIIHRDLKPANIKLRDDGTVKVLDFGLAKAMEPASGLSPAPPEAETITTPAQMTATGVILGTAAYMSPEQAKGRPADKRSDIWAFGCVLYEILTGRHAFAGDDVADTLASVLKGQPDWTALPLPMPSSLHRLLRRCLEKDRKRRLSDMADARLDIDDVLNGSQAGFDTSQSAAGTVAPQHHVERLWAAVAIAMGVGLIATITAWRPWRQAPATPSQRLSVELGTNGTLLPTDGEPLAISPDGGMLAFVTGGSGEGQLQLRRFADLQALGLVAGNRSGANGPFFSPDGQWIGFFSSLDRRLKKISIAGGSAVPICDCFSSPSRGASWGDDGYIVFSPDPQRGPLFRVSSAGGTPERISTLGEREVAHRWPQVLPGAKTVLFTSVEVSSGLDGAKIVAQSLPSGPSRVVLRDAYYGRYLRSGHLVYAQEGSIFAVPFNLERLEITGQAIPIVQGVRTFTRSAASWFDVSETGTLVYVPGQQTANEAPMAWLDRKGVSTPLQSMPPSDWGWPQFAPTGDRLAFSKSDNGFTHVWIYEWASGSMTRLTAEPSDDTTAIWSPDGHSVVFSSSRGDKESLNLYWKSADASGDAGRLTKSGNTQRAGSWHPSGKYVAFYELASSGRQSAIMILPMEKNGPSWKAGTPTPFLGQDRILALNPTFSPDGRWLAYESNETGETEVFVRPFPGPGGRYQVSMSGGSMPVWSRTRNELVFQTGRRLMVASYKTEGNSFHVDPPHPWSNTMIGPRPGRRFFDLHPDGDRLVVNALDTLSTTVPPDKVVLVTNLFDELRRVAVSSRKN